MNTPILGQCERNDLLALLQAVRRGRETQKALEILFAMPESLKKTLRLRWLYSLETATKELGQESRVRVDTMAFAKPLVEWFDHGISDLVRRFLMQLAKVGGPDERVLELLSTVRLGRQSEESLASIVRSGLRERASQFANLLSPDYSKSDLVQEAVTKVVEWAVEEFHGTTECEFWATAHQRLLWMAMDEGRKKKESLPLQSDPGLEGKNSGNSVQETMIGQERRERIDSFIDGWPERDRLLFRLHYGEGISYPKLAELLGGGESHDSVGKRVRALRAELHRRMADK